MSVRKALCVLVVSQTEVECTGSVAAVQCSCIYTAGTLPIAGLEVWRFYGDPAPLARNDTHYIE